MSRDKELNVQKNVLGKLIIMLVFQMTRDLRMLKRSDAGTHSPYRLQLHCGCSRASKKRKAGDDVS